MSKKIKNILILIALVVIIAIIALVVTLNFTKKDEGNNNTPQSENTASIDSLEDLINKVYEKIDTSSYPKVQTTVIDLSQTDTVTMYTGLENCNDLEGLVVSEPLMSSQAYTFLLAKVKKGVNANEIAKKMSEQVDTRRWICVEAEKLYSTNSDNIVFLVMADAEKVDDVYESFKSQVGTVGKLYEKTTTLDEFPMDIY